LDTGLVIAAAWEIADLMEEHLGVPTTSTDVWDLPPIVKALAREAVAIYTNDNVRAECWNKAISDVWIKQRTGKK
jgi:hypothetical protein